MNDYLQQSKALDIRILVHEKYSKYDINDWILKKLNLKVGEKIVDIGCGTGKQFLLYAKLVGNNGLVIGVDNNKENLMKLKDKGRDLSNVKLYLCDMEAIDKNIPKNLRFDVAVSCFAIYYSKTPEKTFMDIRNLLVDGGRFFVCGPNSNNNKEFLELYKKAGGKLPDNFYIHSNFLQDAAIPLFQKYFDNVNVEIFKNPVNFPRSDILIKYWKSTEIYDESISKKFKEVVENKFKKSSSFTTNKEIIGIIGYKHEV